MKAIITFEHSCLTAADFEDGQDFDWLIEQNFDVFRIERINSSSGNSKCATILV